MNQGIFSLLRKIGKIIQISRRRFNLNNFVCKSLHYILKNFNNVKHLPFDFKSMHEFSASKKKNYIKRQKCFLHGPGHYINKCSPQNEVPKN